MDLLPARRWRVRDRQGKKGGGTQDARAEISPLAVRFGEWGGRQDAAARLTEPRDVVLVVNGEFVVADPPKSVKLPV